MQGRDLNGISAERLLFEWESFDITKEYSDTYNAFLKEIVLIYLQKHCNNAKPIYVERTKMHAIVQDFFFKLIIPEIKRTLERTIHISNTISQEYLESISPNYDMLQTPTMQIEWSLPSVYREICRFRILIYFSETERIRFGFLKEGLYPSEGEHMFFVTENFLNIIDTYKEEHGE